MVQLYPTTVFVVDDDQQARDSVCALVRSMGIRAEAFASGEGFLAAYKPDWPGCLVTDVRMYGMSGVELQEKLKAEGIHLPVIVLTAYARTPLTVHIMQTGAVTLLEKPYTEDDLWNAIRKGLTIDARSREEHERRQELMRRLDLLTPKERDVLDRVVTGKPNKVIAKDLGVSVRTVENRRREVYVKMQVESVAELVKLVIEAGVDA